MSQLHGTSNGLFHIVLTQHVHHISIFFVKDPYKSSVVLGLLIIIWIVLSLIPTRAIFLIAGLVGTSSASSDFLFISLVVVGLYPFLHTFAVFVCKFFPQQIHCKSPRYRTSFYENRSGQFLRYGQQRATRYRYGESLRETANRIISNL